MSKNGAKEHRNEYRRTNSRHVFPLRRLSGGSINIVWAWFSAVAANNPALVECTAKSPSEKETGRGYHLDLSGPAWKLLPRRTSMIRHGHWRNRANQAPISTGRICKRCWEGTVDPIARSTFEVRRSQLQFNSACAHRVCMGHGDTGGVPVGMNLTI